MALEFPVGFEQNETYSAEITRRSIWCTIQRGATVGSVVGGLVGPNDFTTTWSGSGLGVTTSTGEALVAGSSTTSQSGYYVRGTSASPNTPAAASPSNPRIDLIALTVQDKAYVGASDTPLLQCLTGTPTALASITPGTGNYLGGAPSVPTSSLALAYVLIPQSASSITNADILNVQQYVNFGPNQYNRRKVSGAGAILALSGDHVIVSSGSTPVTLQAPYPNARVKVTNYGSGVPTVARNSSEVIYGLGLGSAGSATVALGTVGATVTVESDGTNWFVTAGMQDTGWNPITGFTNSWASSSGPASGATVAGHRLAGSVLRLGGTIASGGSGQAAFTLPLGSRPISGLQIPSSYGAGNNVAYATVSTGGVFTPAVSGVGGAISGFPLDGMTFTVD